VFRYEFAKSEADKGNPSSFRAFAPYAPALRLKRLRSTLTH